MRRLALVLALAACSAPAVHPAAPPPPPPTLDAGGAPRVEPEAPPLVVVPQQRAGVEAPHAGVIRVLAVTADGTAAISCDDFGGVRLWPTLDGRNEPRVVDLPEPRALAITARGDGFAVAALDTVGGVYLANLDAEGRTRSHASLPIEPAVVDIAMTPAGLLAWRVDQTVVLIGDDGATKARLGTEPGQQLIAIATAGGRAVAVLASDAAGKRQQRVRALHLEPTLAWGGWFDALGHDVGAHVALSPSGMRLAMLSPDPVKANNVQAFELASGKKLVDEPVGGVAGIAYVDEDHVAAGAASGGIVWVDLGLAKTRRQPLVGNTSPFRAGILGVGGGHAITASRGELAIVTPDATEYLGYELESPTVARPAPGGQLLVGLGGSLAMLDRDLRVAASPQLPLPTGGAISDVRWLGGDDWLVIGGQFADGKVFAGLADLAAGTLSVVRRGAQIVQAGAYEPSTHLVAFGLGKAELDRYDPVKHQLVPVSTAGQDVRLFPLAPKLAGGAQVLSVTIRERTTLAWIRDPAALEHATAKLVVESPFAVADAAGHAYTWHVDSARHLELSIVTNGKPTGVLPLDQATVPWPDPTGSQLVQISANRVLLITLDGTVKWTQPIAGATEALWLSDGAIAIVSAGGIARVDAASGAVTAARCGWRFGLSATPHPAAPRIEPVCAQLAH